MALASQNGIHPAVHAIGDDAVTIALDAFHDLGCPGTDRARPARLP